MLLSEAKKKGIRVETLYDIDPIKNNKKKEVAEKIKEANKILEEIKILLEEIDE